MHKRYFSVFPLFLCSTAWNAFGVDISSEVALSPQQELHVSLVTDAPTCDPQKNEDQTSRRIGDDLFEGLMSEDKDGHLIAGLAEKYQISSDGMSYTFYLRPQAQFSDGAVITADDVVFSLRRLIDPQTHAPQAHLAYPIQNARAIHTSQKDPTTLGVRALDDHTVEIQLAHPSRSFLKRLSLPPFVVLKKEYVLKFPDFLDCEVSAHPLISSGAYQLSAVIPGQKIIAIRNTRYWNQEKTQIQTVHYILSADKMSALKMYDAGKVDIVDGIAAKQFKIVEQRLPQELHVGPSLSTYYFDFNNEKPPFQNHPKLRQALSMLIDREFITSQITRGGERPSAHLVAWGSDDFVQQDPSWTTLSLDERRNEARRLYQESGYGPHKPLSFSVSYNTSPVHQKIAAAVAQMWEKDLGDLGLQVTLRALEGKAFLTARHQGDFEIARDGWIADDSDPFSFLSVLLSHHPANNARYKNEKYDFFLNNANLESPSSSRTQALYQEAWNIAAQDNPIIPLFHYASTYLVKPYVGGDVWKNPLGRVYTRYLYILAH